MHEHMKLDLSGIKKDEDCRLDCYEQTKSEVSELKEKGVSNIVEVTNIGMGRDISYVIKLMEETGMNFIFSTGFYKDPFLPLYVKDKSEKELCGIMEDEILRGIEGSGVHAGIIGEVGTSLDTITPSELKVLKAACMAHNNTGVPITTHTTLGTMAIEQISIFKEYGADLNKIIIGHTDLKGDAQYIKKIINLGPYVEIDTVGKENYLSDEKRLEVVHYLCSQGYSERMVLSMDITRKSHMKAFGGKGYSYLLDFFVPQLRKAGTREEDIQNMLKNNPLKIFGSDVF